MMKKNDNQEREDFFQNPSNYTKMWPKIATGFQGSSKMLSDPDYISQNCQRQIPSVISLSNKKVGETYWMT